MGSAQIAVQITGIQGQIDAIKSQITSITLLLQNQEESYNFFKGKYPNVVEDLFVLSRDNRTFLYNIPNSNFCLQFFEKFNEIYIEKNGVALTNLKEASELLTTEMDKLRQKIADLNTEIKDLETEYTNLNNQYNQAYWDETHPPAPSPVK